MSIKESSSGKSYEYQEEQLRRAFHNDQEEFVDTYVRGSGSVSKMAQADQNSLFDLVPAHLWYFFYYLYSDPNEELPPPCIMPASELPHHKKERQMGT